MSFIDGFKFYYTNLFDISFFIAYFCVSLGLSMYAAPKHIHKKDIWKIVLYFVGVFSVLLFHSSIMFGLSKLVQNNFTLSTIIFSLASPIVVIIFCLIFNRGYALHTFIKIESLVSVLIIADVISKNLGFLFPVSPEEFNLGINFARGAPYLLFLGLCLLMHIIDINHYRNLFAQNVIIISAICFVIILVSIQEHLIDKTDNDFNILLSTVDILLVIILGFTYFATYKSVEYRHKITNLEVQKTLAEAERTSVIVDKVNREELEKIRHDIKNQLSYLDILLKQEKYEEASKYIEDLSNQRNQVLYSFSCSNDIINSIINLELTKAKIRQIKVDVKAVVPPKLPFKNIDLVALLTNMVDNALENYHSNNNEAISVRIFKQNDFIRFIVSNPVDVENVKVQNITTTRKSGRGHGYGTKIIRNVASSYNGYVDFNIEDGHFICDAVLNLDIKE